MDAAERIAKVINEQKGAMLALKALVQSVFRALPLAQQERALEEFDKDCEMTRTFLLNDELPEEVIAGFEQQVEEINVLRRDRPPA